MSATNAALAPLLDRLEVAIAKALPADAPIWRQVHGPADSQVDAMEVAFLEALARLRGRLTLEAVTRALATGDWRAAVNAIDWQAALADPLLAAWTPLLAAVARRAAPAVEQEINAYLQTHPPLALVPRTEQATQAALRFSLNLRDPGFYRAVQEQGAKLVTEVSQSTQQAIRDTVSAAYRDGVHPYDFARTLREMVGLTERQQMAVLNYWKGLSAQGGRSAARVDAMTETYAKRLLRQRANTIARNETLKAANAARMEGYRQAMDAGLVERQTASVQFLTSEDERVCPVCAPLDMTEVPWGQPFQTMDGPFFHPPIHVQCRCTVVLLPEGQSAPGFADRYAQAAAPKARATGRRPRQRRL